MQPLKIVTIAATILLMVTSMVFKLNTVGKPESKCKVNTSALENPISIPILTTKKSAIHSQHCDFKYIYPNVDLLPVSKIIVSNTASKTIQLDSREFTKLFMQLTNQERLLRLLFALNSYQTSLSLRNQSPVASIPAPSKYYQDIAKTQKLGRAKKI
jgi:hypothetical protein